MWEGLAGLFNNTLGSNGLIGEISSLFSTPSVTAGNLGEAMNNGSMFMDNTNNLMGADGTAYSLASNGDAYAGSLPYGVSASAGAGLAGTTKGMFDFMNSNAKGLEAGGKLIGGLGDMYYKQQMAGLAKDQLSDSRNNTAYNRANKATADANLQSASDRVFGVSTPYTDAALKSL